MFFTDCDNRVSDDECKKQQRGRNNGNDNENEPQNSMVDNKSTLQTFIYIHMYPSGNNLQCFLQTLITECLMMSGRNSSGEETMEITMRRNHHMIRFLKVTMAEVIRDPPCPILYNILKRHICISTYV